MVIFMSRSVLVVEGYGLLDSILANGDKFSYISKGPIYDREPFHYGDAEKFAKYDIVILESSKEKAEELRKMMQQFREKETIICWYGFYGFLETTGVYQCTTIDESFYNTDVIASSNPALDVYNVACKKYDSMKLSRKK